jgi:hypothetical protein
VESFSATLTRDESDEDGGWTVVVPEVGQATVADPDLADYEARKLLRRHLNLDWFAAEDLDVRLVDGSGSPLFVFNLLCTGPCEPDRVAALAVGPPAGCRFADFDGMPGLRCVRSGPNRLVAVAALVAQLRDEYGIDADDLGFEKLWEWAGNRDLREQMIAQLLLMATRRARLLGLPTGELVGFVRAAMS